MSSKLTPEVAELKRRLIVYQEAITQIAQMVECDSCPYAPCGLSESHLCRLVPLQIKKTEEELKNGK